MKKLFSLFLVLVMVFAFAVPASAETETPTFVISEETAAPGEEVRVSVSIQNNTGIAAVGFNVEYDHSVLELTNVERGEYTGGQWLAMQPNFDALWIDYINDSHDGLFATLVFNVKADAPTGDSAVSISYNANYVYDEDEDNVYFDIQAGKVTVTAPETAYYLVGSMNEWAVDEAYKFVQNPENSNEYMLPITLAAGDEFKAVAASGTTINTWYPAEGSNYVVGANQAGDVTVYFRPDYSGGEDWHYGCLYIAVPAPEEPAFMTQSLLLDGSLGVIFYVKLPVREGYAYQNVTFSISSATGETEVPFTSDLPKNDNGYYGFTYYVRSIQMADTITATLNYTVDDEPMKLVKEYTVKEYFETYDDNKDLFTEKQQKMTEAVADYGHYVQAFLDSTRDWNVPDDYADMNKFYTTYGDAEKSEATEALEGYTIVRQISEDITDIKFTLVLDSTTEIRVFFKPASTYTGDVTFEVDSSDATAEQLSDGRYVIKITNVAAHELSKTHTILATTQNGLATVEVSALSYAQAMLAAYADNALAVNAVIALYRYSMFADALK